MVGVSSHWFSLCAFMLLLLVGLVIAAGRYTPFASLIYHTPVIGELRLMAPPFLLSDAEQGPERPGPTLAEHTEEVFRGIVGLDAAEYAALEAAGVFK